MCAMIERQQATEFRKWLRDGLNERGWTQAELAWQTGVHPSTVTKWVAGDPRVPSYVQLVQLVRAFRALPPSLLAGCPSSGEPDRELLVVDPSPSSAHTVGIRPRPATAPLRGPFGRAVTHKTSRDARGWFGDIEFRTAI